MNERIRKILEFIFPEYQIIKSINKYGFTASKNKGMETQGASGSIPVKRNNTMQMAAQSHPAGSPKYNNKSTPPVSYDGKTGAKISAGQVNSKIAAAKKNVLSNIVGQTEAVENLMIALKRPLVTGFNKDMPRNTFFIIGRNSSGRHTLLINAVNAAKREGLLNYAGISRLNLALYPTASEKSLFLSDIYKVLYENSEIALFENFENCHPDILSVIISLVTQGKYQFSERYTAQGENLIQATGILMQSSISEMSSNGKYFVFITSSSENKIADTFGSKFMDKVADIIIMDKYSQDEIAEVTKKILWNLFQQVKSNLGFSIQLSAAFAGYCVSKYKKSEGFKSLHGFIMNDIYKALAEYKLRSDNVNADIIGLLDCNSSDGEISISFEKQGRKNAVSLTPFMPKRKTGSIDEIKAELANVIGLTKVKEFVFNLENNLKIQQLREEAGNKVASLSRHMIFTGNPGTGKTTIARVVAKYFKAIGLLTTGHLRETTRSDLVGQYVGHTAKQTNEVIQSALGGVLFIDEAYSLCRDKNDTFGLEAVDALVKAIEDYRDDLIVILAGYHDEMQDFLKNNSGLKSRFPHIIDFEDYTTDEMVQIAHITAKFKGYVISENCTDGLIRLFEKSQIKGRNDGGNGRLVRNIIEAAILEQSKRITKDTPKDDMNLLLSADFNFENFETFDLEKRFAGIIGLNNVKDFVRTQYTLLVANEKRRKAGISIDATQSLNMIFTGNPGTGKTTIARVVASMFKDMGMLKKGHLIETDRSGLVAGYVGQTSKKTEEIFRDALGGVLFIDEAYALSDSGSGFGKEAIDTLVKLVEDYRGEIVVILAGYKKEMSDFLKTNSGLESRFPLVIDFPDYNVDELYAIAERLIDAKGFLLTDEAKPVFREKVIAAHKSSNTASGNGRMVRNIVEKVMRNQSARIASIENVSKHELTEILAQDIKIEQKAKAGFNLEQTFEKIVGLSEVKGYVRSLEARLKIQSKRKKMGLPVDNAQSLHMIFKGNPGTGKTMIARTIADVLHNLGIIKTNKLIETDRSGLVAGYVGQTAIKTTEKIMEAMDGILFIDEAYGLSQGGSNDFGREAIDTLVKLMDDNRERLVVILAGYSSNMDGFLKTNPGLKSRFPNIIEFPDYSLAELLLIADNLYHSKEYALDAKAKKKLSGILKNALTEESFGNGRYVRNLFERSVNKQALRLSSGTDLTREKLTSIIADDIEEI